MVLEGGPYGCYEEYIVVVEDKNGNPMTETTLPRVQVDGNDFGIAILRLSQIPQQATAVGERSVLRTNYPPLVCPRNITLSCDESTDPSNTGNPIVIEHCGRVNLTFHDHIVDGSCEAGYDRHIERTWTAEDPAGNTSTCTQVIWVELGDLSTLSSPPDWNDIDEPSLSCDEKRDDRDISAHLLPPPQCVDGYLLDSAVWLGTGNRVPRVLGWNCLASGKYAGHPSPYDLYYPAHPGCWGDYEHVMWHGTGVPGGADCSNIQYTFSDARIDAADPGCDAGDVGCYKILRKWLILDWCTGDVEEINQIIKVLDKEGPEIGYPDEITVGTEVWRCYGRWEIAEPWLSDNCSNDVSYTVHSNVGTLIGNATNGFILIDLPLGWHTVYLEAFDCCGNSTIHRIELHVEDDSPPVAVCDAHTVVSLSSGPEPNTNISKVYAETFDDGSHDNCNDVCLKSSEWTNCSVRHMDRMQIIQWHATV